MFSFTSRALRSAKAAILPETKTFEGSVIPARHLRFGGKYFQSDEDFVRSGEQEADRLVRSLDLHAGARLLEVGCGPGRLAIGILRRVGALSAYRAVDVDRLAVRWCQRHIQAKHPSFHFTHLDVANERYNPSGTSAATNLRLPFDDRSFDIVYLYSVFSHLAEPDVRSYVAEFSRLLVPGGRIFLTAFLERDVPPVSINPAGYRREWRGPLHCVRYEHKHFEALLAERRIAIEHFDFGVETDGQSSIVARLR